MSPTSQGALEVERYIGSCLISSSARPALHKSVKKQELQLSRGKPRYPQNYPTSNSADQCQVQYATNAGWAGAPLISMTSSPRRNNHRSSPALPQQQQQQQQTQQQQLATETDQANIHQRSPLSRLAIHTQGAPLILTGRFQSRGKVQNGNGVNNNNNNNNSNSNNNNTNSNNNNNGTVVPSNVNLGNGARCPPPRFQRSVDPLKKTSNLKEGPSTGKDINGGNVASIDSLSIASDESSGSNNSENSLPRIIKPRKRRKKDRKPPNVTTDISKSEELAGTVSEASSIVTLKPYVPVCYERFEPHRTPPAGHRRPPSTRESYASGRPHSNQEIVDTRQRYHRHLVKVLDNNRNVVAMPPGRGIQQNGIETRIYRNGGHQFVHVVDSANEGTGCEEGVFEGPGSCQCRYCDPSGLIWDVDQNGYSPYLTPPPTDYNGAAQYSRVPLFLSQGMTSSGQEKAVEHLEEPSAVTSFYLERENAALRRSWSDPTSFFSEEITPNRSVGVIGDRAPVETAARGKRANSWRSWSTGGHTSSSGTSQGLEVSTEIVTSPNGHRDLEIKFYSSSPPTAVPDDCKSDFAFPDEDFSDIWSYHESKLQQDFRTLLQAEE